MMVRVALDQAGEGLQLEDEVKIMTADDIAAFAVCL